MDTLSSLFSPALRSLFCTIAFLVLLLPLAGCETGGGYGQKIWDYDADKRPVAQAPPRNLDLESDKAAAAKPLSAMGAEAQGPATPVALLLPLTGSQAALGQAMLKAAQMALFDMHVQGVTLLPRDTGSTPQGAATAAQVAISSGAQIILGPVFAEEVKAVQPAARQANIPMLAFSTDWNVADSQTYVMGFMPFDQIDRIAAYAASKKILRLGILRPNTAYGQAVGAAFTQVAPRYGITIVRDMALPATGAARESTLGEFASGTYDGVFMPFNVADATAASRDLAKLGLSSQKVIRLGTGLWDDPQFLEGGQFDYGWFAAPDPQNRRGFEDRYRTLYNAMPPRLASLAYDATALVAVLIQRGDSTTASPFNRAALLNPNGFSGIDGIFRFRDNGLAERGLAVLELQGRRLRKLEPAPQSFQR